MKRRRGSRRVADREGGLEGSPDPNGGPIRHIPVLLPEMLTALQPKDGERYIDGTFGAGGYTRAILAAANCKVLALDRDPNAIADGEPMRADHAPRLHLIQTPFSNLDTAARDIGWDRVNGIVFDLGVSSMQLDEAERGFSFMRDGPLDMRMSQSGLSAADVVNTFERDEIANILYELGEERRSRAIAAAIVKDREQAPFQTTAQLADLVARVLGRRHDDAKHPATRTFQALRLFVNDELGELERALVAAEETLVPGGRLVVVTFHSLEDRIVKRFFADRSGKQSAGSRHAPPVNTARPITFRLLNRHGVTPSEQEISSNPRSRSARLRAAIRLPH